jgi:hypothetical protein
VTDYMRSVLTGLAFVGTIFVGLFFMLGGALGIGYELTHPPVHTSHVWLFFCASVLGALMLPAIGGLLLKALKSGLDVAGPYLPVFGRRVNSGEITRAPPKDGAP